MEEVLKFDNFFKGHMTLTVISCDAKINFYEPPIIKQNFNQVGYRKGWMVFYFFHIKYYRIISPWRIKEYIAKKKNVEKNVL